MNEHNERDATQAAIEAMLEQWLPNQRWFAGKDSGAPTVRVTAHRVLQAGDPCLAAPA